MDPLSARCKATGWSVPDFSLESRTKRSHAHTLPDLAHLAQLAPSAPFSFRPPDEEKGRAFRSSTQRSSQSTLFGASGPDADKHSSATVIQPLAHNLAAALVLDGADDDALFDAWHADGGAQGHDDSGFVEHDSANCFPSNTPSPPLSASAKWTRAIDHAVLNADGNIQLSGQKLGEVPNAVWELSTLRSFTPSSPSRTFSRTASVPVPKLPTSPKASQRLFGRTSTVSFGSPTSYSSSSALAAATVGVVLMLSGNDLTTASLSNALWTLPNLQVLSLRNNLLDTLPAGIGRLTGLRELSLAQNQLRFLPAEILHLENLANLTLHPNPFLLPPAPTSDEGTKGGASAPRRRKRVLGPLVTHFTVPSLVETCTRILLTEATTSNSALPSSLSASTSSAPAMRHIQNVRGGVEYLRSLLAAPLFAPFHSTFYPPASLVSSSSSITHTPFSSRIRQPSQSTAPAHTQPFDPLSSICRSPSHADAPRVFVKHAVERIEWVSEGRLRGGCGGGGSVRRSEGEVREIPLLWRGCGARCLDWLEEEEEQSDGDDDDDEEVEVVESARAHA